ncbi:hypothetical protein MT418_007289 [Batrachochytrium dendrobatidis]
MHQLKRNNTLKNMAIGTAITTKKLVHITVPHRCPQKTIIKQTLILNHHFSVQPSSLLSCSNHVLQPRYDLDGPVFLYNTVMDKVSCSGSIASIGLTRQSEFSALIKPSKHLGLVVSRLTMKGFFWSRHTASCHTFKGNLELCCFNHVKFSRIHCHSKSCGNRLEWHDASRLKPDIFKNKSSPSVSMSRRSYYIPPDDFSKEFGPDSSADLNVSESHELKNLQHIISTYEHIYTTLSAKKRQSAALQVASAYDKAYITSNDKSLNLDWKEYKCLLQIVPLARSPRLNHHNLTRVLVQDLIHSNVVFTLDRFNFSLRALHDHPSGVFLYKLLIKRLHVDDANGIWKDDIYWHLLKIHVFCDGPSFAEDWIRQLMSISDQNTLEKLDSSIIPKKPLKWNKSLYHCLALGYARQGDVERASVLISDMAQGGYPYISCVEHSIRALCRIEKVDEAFTLYQQYKYSDHQPSIKLFENMIWGILVVQFRAAFHGKRYSRIDIPLDERHLVPKFDPNTTIDIANRIMVDLSKAGYIPSVLTVGLYLTHFMIYGKYNQAIDLYDAMTRQDMKWDIISLTVMLKVFFSCKNTDRATEIISLYDQCGFDRDVVFYGTLMDGYHIIGDTNKSLEYYREFLGTSCTPNQNIYHIALSIYGTRLDMQSAERIWSEMEQHAIPYTEMSYSIMIHGYGLCGDLYQANAVFNSMMSANVVMTEASYNTLMNAHINNREYNEAEKIYERMINSDIQPDIYSFNILLKSHLIQLKVAHTNVVLRDMQKSGVDPTSHTYITLIQLYTSTGHMDEALRVHQVLKDLPIYNEQGSDVPLIARSAFLNQYSLINNWEAFEGQIELVKKEGIAFTSLLHESIVMGYYRRGGLDDALVWYREALGSGCELKTRFFNRVIHFCIDSGHATNAIQVANDMLQRGVKPDIFTYTWLLRAGIVLSDTGIASIPAASKSVKPLDDQKDESFLIHRMRRKMV